MPFRTLGSRVLTASGRSVDVDLAQEKMDPGLAVIAAAWVSDNWERLAEQGATDRDQAFWDYYCERHLEMFGVPFGPDVDHDAP